MRTVILSILLSIISFSIFAQNLDINLLRQINVHRNTSLDQANIFISNSVGPVSIGVPLLMFGTSFINENKELRRNSIVIAASLGLSSVITTVLKYGVNRDRPFVTYPDIQKVSNDAGSPSFPSGHTSAAFSTATSLSLLYPKWYVIAPSFVWASAVGYSRMHLGAHYPSDVLAGAIVGAGSAWICYKVNKMLLSKGKWKNH